MRALLLRRAGGDLSRSGAEKGIYHFRDGGNLDQQLGHDNPCFALTRDRLRNGQHDPADTSDPLNISDLGCENLWNYGGFDILRHFGRPRVRADELPPAESIGLPPQIVNANYGQSLNIAGNDTEPHAMQFALLAMQQRALCGGRPRAVSSPLHGQRLAAGAGAEGNRPAPVVGGAP